MTEALHNDELSSQVLNGLGEPGIAAGALATPSGITVLQRSISLAPGYLISELRIIPNQRIGVALGDGMKQGVIHTAYGSTQIGLVWAALRKTLGDHQQIVSNQIPAPDRTKSNPPWECTSAERIG